MISSHISSTKKSLLTSPIVSWSKYLISLVPFIFIFATVDLQRLVSSLNAIAWWTVPVLCFLTLISMTLQGVRWWYLLRALIPTLSFRKALSAHFAGLFYGIVLPSSAGQDLVRAVILSRTTDYGVVWGATWICRLMGFFALALLSIVGFFQGGSHLFPHLKLYAGIAITGLLVLFAVSFTKRFTRPIRNIVSKAMPKRMIKIVEEIREGTYRFRGKPLHLAGVTILTVVMQAISILNTGMLVLGVTGKGHFIACLTFMPLIEIACLVVPLTPNGLGVREALASLMFAQIGLTKEQIGTYILVAFLGMLLKLVGVFFLPFARQQNVSNNRAP